MSSTPDALVAWLRLLAVEQRLSLRLSSALLPHRLALADYEVLVRVVQAGDAGLRMQELARRVFLTDSGMTRLVARLEGQGLLSRGSVEGDQRGRTCRATESGRELLHAAQPAFLASLKEAFGEALTQQELRAFGALLGKIATTPDADAHAVPRRKKT